jgi:hypothetical protein
MEVESIEKHGNPHFVTLNGSSYTFRGQGEYTLISLPKIDQQVVQIRLASNENDSTIGIVAFVIGSLQTRKSVQFELFPMHQHLEIRINSRLIEIPDEEFAVPVIIYEDQYLKIKRKINGTFKISFPGSPFRFHAQIRSTFDFFELETLLEREKFIKLSTPSVGLLGDINGLAFPNGTRLSINNQTDENILFEYGESWRITRNTSLFYYLFDDITHYQSNSIRQSSNQQNCDDHMSQQCSQSELFDENDAHRLYQSDQHHLESLTVTIESNVLPEIKVNHAFNDKYSYLTLFFYSLLIRILM